MYGIFSYIWLMFMINVGEYTIHGSYGKQYEQPPKTNGTLQLGFDCNQIIPHPMIVECSEFVNRYFYFALSKNKHI